MKTRREGGSFPPVHLRLTAIGHDATAGRCGLMLALGGTSLASTLRMYVRRTPKLSEPTDLFTHRLIARWPTKVPPEDPRIVAAIESALPSR